MDSNHSSYTYTSMNKSITEIDPTTTEESGWTSYFEDFMVAQQQDHHLHNNSSTHHHHHHHHHEQQQHDRPELSDAASHVDWNNMTNSINGAAPKFSNKLNLIKKSSRRTREIRYDDSLEDTASSPVNSPKVGSQHMGFNQFKVDDIMDNSLGKQGGFESHMQLQKREDDQSMKMVFEDANNGASTDLRKRGLCLVPLSMFINYV
ncbi:vascular-related unknown protein 1-like [Rutidosis leptorrhynchoides]|uniref:vascular-related unknown protein 1-like n=1 Tax=Rutidosis leptorrhynchoides TaxID=125765 RepID=UPI003A99B269